jgi:tryptophan synthase beta chain
LAEMAGKKRIVAETGAGQHGVAVASVCALLNIECIVYMGAVDMERQAPNVARMGLLGAEIRSVQCGSRTLKDATSEAIRDWVTNVRTTHYLIGSVVGPHPYPLLVRTFASRIGIEARRQVLAHAKRLPDAIVACVGGGSNAIGVMHAFLKDKDVALHGVEAGGRGSKTGMHAASIGGGKPGVLHGAYSYLLQDSHGQIAETHSISAGLDYPGVGPELASLRDSGRVRFASIRDEQGLAAFQECARLEGILPALESAHALAYTKQIAAKMPENSIILVNLSGRGDKDLATVCSTQESAARNGRSRMRMVTA